MKKPFVILSGPTAVGKSELSIELAKRIGGEIISADSMQVYKGMDIGTAKLTKEEMQGIPHFLIDILEPDEDFNVMKFKELAREAAEGIYNRGHIPVLTGGTGFYIQSVIYDIDFAEHGGNERKKLEEYAKIHGGECLYEILKREDPVTAETIHPNNLKKVIRAIEFYRETGASLALHNEEQRKKESPYNFAYFVLTCNREVLYERINKRVDVMMEQGLLNEVKTLKEKGINRNCVSMAGLGYRQLYNYLSGECTYEEAVEKIKLETRHFAKRQLTWFRREKDVIWIDKERFPGLEDQLGFIEGILSERRIK